MDRNSDEVVWFLDNAEIREAVTERCAIRYPAIIRLEAKERDRCLVESWDALSGVWLGWYSRGSTEHARGRA